MVFDIFILVWIWSLVFDTPMILFFALYLDFEAAQPQHQGQHLNPSQEPPASSKAPTADLKNMDILGTFKIKIERQNLEHWCNKDQCPYLNQDQDAKPQSENSSIFQSTKSGLKRHGCSLHLQNQDREPKFGA